MELNDAVQSLVDAGDWLGLLGYYWDSLGAFPYVHAAVVGCGVIVLLILLLAIVLPAPDAQALREKPLPPVSTAAVKPRGPVFIPFELGEVTIDLQPSRTETLHVVIGGATRTGKTTSVLPLFDLPIGVLCIALDVTTIEEKVRSVGGVVWTNDPAECQIGLDITGGPARIASEGLVAGFPKAQGNVGDYQRSARSVIWTALDAMDAAGVERNIPDVIRALLQPIPDPETARACRSWARKLGDLYRIIGPTVGHDLDVVQAMRDGQKVLLKLNHFLSPDDAPFLAGLLLVLGRRVEEQAGVPFVLIVEEAGQAAIAQGHLAPMAQAGAARGAALVVITQNMSTLPLEVRNNLSVTVSFAQEDPVEQRAAAARLELEPEQVRRSAFPDKGVGWCYVRAPGVPTTLVHVKRQRPEKRAPSRNIDLDVGTVGTGPSVQRYVVRELDGWHPERPMLVAPRQEPVPSALQTPDGLRIWGKLQRTGRRAPLWQPSRGLWWAEHGCLVWTKGTNGKRPKTSIGSKSLTAYKWVYEQVVGPVPAGLTLDHMCGNVSCCDWTHLDPCTLEENNRREPLRKAAFAVAWRVRGVGVGAAAD